MNRNTSSLLMEKGIRPSPQRVAIMQYLSTHLTHPTVEEVYSELHPTMPTLSKTTIYNTLKLFEEKGVIMVLRTGEQELHLDAITEKHAHFTCIECGKIMDIPYTPGQSEIDNQLSQNSALTGCHIVNTQLHFSGICAECLKKMKDKQ